MKIGVSSYSFSAYMRENACDYLRVCDLAKEIGFEYIEFIDLLPSVSGCDDLEAARRIRKHCAGIGLGIAAYTVGAEFLKADDRKAEVRRIKHCVDVAEELGAAVMRHDATTGPKTYRTGYTWRDAIGEIAPFIREITEYAAEKGIRTCTENHGFYIQDAERVETLIREVGHTNYGWLVDIGNFLCADADCLQSVNIAAPYAFHAHAKDFLRKCGAETDPGERWFRSRGGNYLRGTVLGHGVVPVAQCVELLKNAGYDGVLSLEFEGMEENIPALKAGLDFLKRILGV